MPAVEVDLVMIEQHLAHLKAISEITSTLHVLGASEKLHHEIMLLNHYLIDAVQGIEALIYGGEGGCA